MLEGVLVNVLNRVLGKYIDNLEYNQLNLGIWSGDVTLTDLKLKKEALDEFQIPIEIVEELTMKIPWQALKTKPVQLHIKSLYLLVVPKFETEYDEALEIERSFKRKLDKLSAAELLTTSTDFYHEDAKNQSFLNQLVTKIVDNLQITIEKIHIRYEDKVSQPEAPFSIGFTLSHLSAVSVNDQWVQCELEDSADKKVLYKLIKMGGVSVYMNTEGLFQPFKRGESTSEFVTHFNELIPDESREPMEHHYLLKPISCEGKLCVQKRTKSLFRRFEGRAGDLFLAVEELLAKYDFAIEFDEIGVSLDDEQYSGFSAMYEMFSRFLTAKQYRKFRPTLSLEEDPSSWFRYVGNAVLENVKELRRPFRWDSIKRFIEARKQYHELYYKKMKEKHADPLLVDLEKELSINVLLEIRQQVMKQIQEEREAQRLLALSQPTSPTSVQSLFSRIWQWGSGTPAVQEGPSEELKELYEVIDFNEEDTESLMTSSSSHIGDSFLYFAEARIKIVFKQMKLQLVNKTEQLMTLALDGLMLEYAELKNVHGKKEHDILVKLNGVAIESKDFGKLCQGENVLKASLCLTPFGLTESQVAQVWLNGIEAVIHPIILDPLFHFFKISQPESLLDDSTLLQVIKNATTLKQYSAHHLAFLLESFQQDVTVVIEDISLILPLVLERVDSKSDEENAAFSVHLGKCQLQRAKERKMDTSFEFKCDEFSQYQSLPQLGHHDYDGYIQDLNITYKDMNVLCVSDCDILTCIAVVSNDEQLPRVQLFLDTEQLDVRISDEAFQVFMVLIDMYLPTEATDMVSLLNYREWKGIESASISPTITPVNESTSEFFDAESQLPCGDSDEIVRIMSPDGKVIEETIGELQSNLLHLSINEPESPLVRFMNRLDIVIFASVSKLSLILEQSEMLIKEQDSSWLNSDNFKVAKILANDLSVGVFKKSLDLTLEMSSSKVEVVPLFKDSEFFDRVLYNPYINMYELPEQPSYFLESGLNFILHKCHSIHPEFATKFSKRQYDIAVMLDAGSKLKLNANMISCLYFYIQKAFHYDSKWIRPYLRPCLFPWMPTEEVLHVFVTLDVDTSIAFCDESLLATVDVEGKITIDMMNDKALSISLTKVSMNDPFANPRLIISDLDCTIDLTPGKTDIHLGVTSLKLDFNGYYLRGVLNVYNELMAGIDKVHQTLDPQDAIVSYLYVTLALQDIVLLSKRDTYETALVFGCHSLSLCTKYSEQFSTVMVSATGFSLGEVSREVDILGLSQVILLLEPCPIEISFDKSTLSMDALLFQRVPSLMIRVRFTESSVAPLGVDLFTLFFERFFWTLGEGTKLVADESTDTTVQDALLHVFEVELLVPKVLSLHLIAEDSAVIVSLHGLEIRFVSRGDSSTDLLITPQKISILSAEGTELISQDEVSNEPMFSVQMSTSSDSSFMKVYAHSMQILAEMPSLLFVYAFMMTGFTNVSAGQPSSEQVAGYTAISVFDIQLWLPVKDATKIVLRIDKMDMGEKAGLNRVLEISGVALSLLLADGERVALMDPSRLSLVTTFDSHSEKSMFTVDPIVLKCSFQDLLMVQSMAARFDMRIPQVHSHFTPIDPILTRSSEMEVECGQVRLLLIDDASAVYIPILDVVLTQLKGFYAAGTGQLAVDACIRYMNMNTSMWEPFLEPWRFMVSCEVSASGTAVRVASDSRANINLTRSFLTYMSQLMEASSESNGQRLDVIQKRMRREPYRIVNESGCELRIWQASLEEDVTQIWKLRNGESVEVCFEHWQETRRGLHTRLHAIGIHFLRQDMPNAVPLQWTSASAVPVYRETKMTIRHEPKSMEEASLYGRANPTLAVPIHEALLSVALEEDNQKVVRILSPLMIENTSSMPFEIGTLFKGELLAWTLPPRERIGLPPLLAYWHHWRIRPAQGYGWSRESFHWKDFTVHPLQELEFSCEATHEDKNELESLFYCHVYAVPQSTATSMTTANYPSFTLRVLPPFQLRNLLPFTVHYKLMDKVPGDEHSAKTFTGELQPYDYHDKEAKYSVDLWHIPCNHVVGLAVHLYDDNVMLYKSSCVGVIHTGEPGSFSRKKASQIGKSLADIGDASLDVSCMVTGDPLTLGVSYAFLDWPQRFVNRNATHASVHGYWAKGVTLFSPYILWNETSLPLRIKQQTLLKSKTESTDTKNITFEGRPRLFSYASGLMLKSRAVIGLCTSFEEKTMRSEWSKPVSLEAIGSCQEVRLRVKEENDLFSVYNVGVEVCASVYLDPLTDSPLLATHHEAKQIRLRYKYLLSNGLSTNLVVMNAFTFTGSCTVIKGETAPYHLDPDAQVPKRKAGDWAQARDLMKGYFVRIYIQESNQEDTDMNHKDLSPPLDLMTVGTVHVRVGGKVLQCRTFLTENILITHITETHLVPFYMSNGSPFPLAVYQKHSAPDTRTLYELAPGCERVSFCWDLPSIKYRRAVLVLGDEVLGELDLSQLGIHAKPIRIGHRSLVIESSAEDLAIHIRIAELKEKLKSEETVRSEPTFSLEISLKEIGVSLIHDQRPLDGDSARIYEILYAYAADLTISWRVASEHTTFGLLLAWLQLDNQTTDSILFYPTLLNAPSNTSTSVSATNALPFLKIGVIVKNGNDTVTCVPYAGCVLQEATLELDEEYLYLLIDFFMVSKSQRAHVLSYTEFMKPPSVIDHSDALYYLEVFQLHPIRCNLTFQRVEETELYHGDALGLRSTLGGPVGFLLDVLSISLGNIHDAPLQFNALLLQHPILPLSLLASLVRDHLSQQGVSQLHRLIGSADFLGNPIGLFNSFAEGVSDLFYEPYLGFVSDKPQDFGIGIAKGGVSLLKNTVFGVTDTLSKFMDAVSKGISLTTFDKDFQRQRILQRRKNTPRHAISGVGLGAKSFLTSVASGITGIVARPVEAVKEEGVSGLWKGMGKGVIGVITKPVLGVVDLASTVTQGIRNTTTLTDAIPLEKVRLPRPLYYDHILRAYSPLEAFGQYCMLEANRGDAYKSLQSRITSTNVPIFYISHLPLSSSELLIVTTGGLLNISPSSLSLNYLIPFSLLSKVLKGMDYIRLDLIVDTSPSMSSSFTFDSKLVHIDQQSQRDWLIQKIEFARSVYKQLYQ